MSRSARLLCVLTLLFGLTAIVGPGGFVPTARAGIPDAQFVRIAIDEVTPQITKDSANAVVIRGNITNFGDRDVRDLQMRIQRGPAVATSAELRSDLVADNSSYDTVGRFSQVSRVLRPGQRAPFTLTMPVRSPAGATAPTGPTLGIDRPGVYPILVNLNGLPAYGGTARLDDSRTLLPVLALPGSTTGTDPAADPSGASASAADSGAVQSAVTDSPAQMTLMWPLADNPKLAAGSPGSDGDTPVRLVDDSLAKSLAAGGRLDGLLGAYDTATRGTDARSSALRTASCLTIDPDLLVTVQAMTDPYRVSTDPADPRARTTAGTGSDAAQAWLERLRRVAANSCVVALPFGQVDIEALALSSDAALKRAALATPADIVDAILNIRSIRGVTVPTSGVLLPAGAGQLGDESTAQSTATVLAATAVRAPASTSSQDDSDGPGAARGIVPVGRGIGAALFDPNVSTALAAMGGVPDGAEPGVRPQPTGTTPTDVMFDLTGESDVARRQAAVGALTASALEPTQSRSAGGSGTTDPVEAVTGRSALIAPPQIWAAGPDDARAVLATASTLLDTGLASPRDFRDVVGAAQTAGRAAPSGPAVWTLRQPAGTTPSRVGAGVVTDATASARRVTQLGAALLPLPNTGLTPASYTSPLREDSVRALRWAPARAAVAGDAAIRLAALRSSLDMQVGSVAILSPGGTYTLASDKSPLLLVARNDLPLPIRTVVRYTAPEGFSIDASQVEELPARGSRQLELPTTVPYSRQVAVQLALRSSSNLELGEPIEVSVHSNAYGRPLFWVTCGAGVLLVLLSGRRLWRRFRGTPDRADIDRPPAGERDRLLANSYAAHRHPPQRTPPDEPEPRKP